MRHSPSRNQLSRAPAFLVEPSSVLKRRVLLLISPWFRYRPGTYLQCLEVRKSACAWNVSTVDLRGNAVYQDPNGKPQHERSLTHSRLLPAAEARASTNPNPNLLTCKLKSGSRGSGSDPLNLSAQTEESCSAPTRVLDTAPLPPLNSTQPPLGLCCEASARAC